MLLSLSGPFFWMGAMPKTKEHQEPDGHDQRLCTEKDYPNSALAYRVRSRTGQNKMRNPLSRMAVDVA